MCLEEPASLTCQQRGHTQGSAAFGRSLAMPAIAGGITAQLSGDKRRTTTAINTYGKHLTTFQLAKI